VSTAPKQADLAAAPAPASINRFPRDLRAFAVLVAILLVAPLAGAYPIFLMTMLCYALFACAFNLLMGYAGLLSFGHAAFIGSAAYIAGHALRVWGWPAPVGLLLGAAVGAGLGLVIGWLAIRRTGVYLTMITLAFGQLLYFVYLQASFTGGEDGLQGVPRGAFFGLPLSSDLNLYYVVLAIFVGCFLLIYRTVHSPFGQILKAIRENEPRTISLGYDTARFKLIAFVISAAIAGLAGAMKTLVLGFATLSDSHWSLSGLVILMTLVGGVGTLLGPIFGAFAIVALENKISDVGTWLARVTGLEWFSSLGESATIVTGVIFVACVMLFRRGVVGEFEAWRSRRRN
jgi:branched-chain amino acid transport system permease protein